MNGLGAIIRRDLRLLFFDRVNLLLSLLNPLVYMCFYAVSISHLLGSLEYAGQLVRYDVYAVAGVLAVTSLSSGSQVANSVFSEVSSGSGLEIWSSPISTSAYLGGRLLAICLYTLSQTLLMLLVGLLVTGYWPGLWTCLITLLCTVLGSLTFGSLLLLIGFYVRSPNRFMMVLNIFMTVAIFAAPIFYTLASMPLPLRVLAVMNPATYVVDLIRGVLLRAPLTVHVAPVGVCAAVTVACLLVDGMRLLRLRARL